MTKSAFIEYINKFELEKALKELTDKKEGSDFEYRINLALLNRYQDNLVEGIQILESLFNKKDQLEDSINFQVSILLLFYYNMTNKPPRAISDVKSYLQFLKSQRNIEELGPFWLALNKYSEGKGFAQQNNIAESIKSYLEAITYLEKQDNKYELMLGYFLLGSTYKEYGDFYKAQEYLEKSLKIVPKADDFRKALYQNYLSEIFFLRSKTNYKKALDYLNSSLTLWKLLNNQFGISWSIHDLGLVHYLAGDLTKAFEFLKTSYSLITPETDIQFKVRNLLSLIELSTELKSFAESNHYFNELKVLIEFDFLYEDELQLAETFIKRQTQHLMEKIFTSKIFDRITSKNKLQYELKIKILLNHLDLMLEELKFAISDEAVTVSKGIVNQILEYSDKFYNLLVQTTVLVDKFNELIEDKHQEIPFNAMAMKDLNQLFHSIPRLSILLYILPRKGVTFSELEEVTRLTQANITTHTTKLIQEGIMESDKQLIENSLVTVYSMTEKGIKEFELYVKSITDFLQSFLN